ncbi:hypothetical protein [Streptomyces sp. NBC_00503]|uniref:hypothetical protein n=1 Tax=Streptomyces sp. NBC_00503 TaxID=2903659 RepID=UPI002E8141BC|nr:hypothetical protein [Streptomyces sp. NBC_00503]WUD82056.1 hypothetical protein OG490_16725 [Streptomyces sp. NBC_00503]
MTITPQSGSAQAGPDAARPGDALVKAGGIVFILGAAATLATMAPLFLHTRPFPSYAWAVCMLMGVGFAISAAGVVRSASAQRRAARASQA